VSDSEADRDARRRARADWPIRKFELGEEPPDDLSHLSPEERVALLCELSIRTWLLAGNELPDVPRSRWPGRVLRSA
jgi:hypothetical protein